MELRNDKRQKTQTGDFSSRGAGEAQETQRKETESLPALDEHESPAVNCLEPPCTDPYARWCGRGRWVTAAPMPIKKGRSINRRRRAVLFNKFNLLVNTTPARQSATVAPPLLI